MVPGKCADSGSWGLETGKFDSPAQFASRARAADYRWVCMEWNAYGNNARGPAMTAACANEGLIFTIWLTRDFTAPEVRRAVWDSGCSGVLVEGEIPAESDTGIPNPQAVNWPELIEALSEFSIPKGVVTNMAPFTHHDGTPYPEKAAPLVEAGCSCHTECYDLDGNPNNWPERRAFFASHLGWKATQPVLWVYGGRTLDDFPTRDEYRN